MAKKRDQVKTREEEMFPEVEALARKCGVRIMMSCLIKILDRAHFPRTVTALRTARCVYDLDRREDDD